MKWCFVGFGLTGSGQFDSIDPHASLFELIDTESCTIHIAGWSPMSIVSLPAGSPFYLVAQLWDVEDGPTGNWYSTFVHLLDGNHRLYGHVTYLRVKANVGVQPWPLTLVGGSNIKLNHHRWDRRGGGATEWSRPERRAGDRFETRHRPALSRPPA